MIIKTKYDEIITLVDGFDNQSRAIFMKIYVDSKVNVNAILNPKSAMKLRDGLTEYIEKIKK